MRVVHISDFHIDYKELDNISTEIIKPLLKDLSYYNQEKKIDAIFFTGDLVDKGGASFESDIDFAFECFEEYIVTPLLEGLALPKSNFIIAPGNHDLVKGADSDLVESGLQNKLKDLSSVNEFIDKNEDEGIKRIIPYKNFEKDFYKEAEEAKEITNFQSTFELSLDSQTVGITAFNTVWRCNDSKNDMGNLLIGERQFQNSRKLIDDADIKIGLLHHTFDFLSDIEKNHMEKRLSSYYDILLFGHVHSGHTSVTINSLGTSYVSVSPSNWSINTNSNSREFSNGYSIIDFDFSIGQITTHYRRYHPYKETFDPNTDYGDSNGVTTFQLPNSSEKSNREYENDLVKKIQEVHLVDLDQHLLTYNTQTTAPKNLQDVFVEPKIIFKEEVGVNDNDKILSEEETYQIEEICQKNDNILLIGCKESGKTVLLDKLLCDFTDQIDSLRKIPVYVDLNEIKTRNTKIETLVNRYLGISMAESKQLLENHKIVLLIDNIQFNKVRSQFLTNLDNATDIYENLQIIATCTTEMEGEIPIKALDYPIFRKFMPLHIKGFQTKQMRELMGKWFSSSNVSSDRLEDLISIFTSFNLPRTPLAVSMFLWILEKQEDYTPVNNSMMLENFIERLFAKTSQIEVYSNEFSYRNKERLLTDIAFYMYTEGNVNYRLTYKETRDFIDNKLKLKKFDYNDEGILLHFLDKGIFLEEKDNNERYIKFRFTCFFHYFLMKNIEIHNDFKNKVVSRENYLKFEEEIDYFTGINQDEHDILHNVVKWMEEDFQDLVERIEELQFSYDNAFETRRPLADSLESEDIEEITNKEKPTEDDIDQIHDQNIEESVDNGVIESKETKLSPLETLQKQWILASKVLKNSEEVEAADLKLESFKKINKSSLAFANLYSYLSTDYVEKSEDLDKNKKENLKIVNRLLPFIHQKVFFETIATGKLSVVMRETIDEIINDESVSDFEKFNVVFSYADLKGPDHLNYIQTLVKNVRRNYMVDMSFIKILNYYFYGSSQNETLYKNLLGDLKNKGKGLNPRRKGHIIQQLTDEKRQKELQGQSV